MLTDDFERFENAVRGLEFTYGKKVSDEAMQQYWMALKDLPFEVVSERIKLHTRYGKFFPKPVELRPKDERPLSSGNDPVFAGLGKRADARLDELCKTDRSEWLRQVSPKIYEAGRNRGMSDQEIAQKLRDYAPWNGRATG